MKKTAQPQRAQGEWKPKEAIIADDKCWMDEYKNYYTCDLLIPNSVEDEIIGRMIGWTQKEAKEKAQRIVTCVNEYEALKKKADMHDELVESVKVQLDIIKNLIASKRVVNLDEAISYYEQLIKQAGQK